MPFTLECPHCNRSLKAPETLAGKTVHCPRCGQPMKVPPVAHTPSPPSRSHHSAAAEGDDSVSPSRPATAAPLPSGMPPLPDGHPPARVPSDQGTPAPPAAASVAFDVPARPPGLVWIVFYWAISGAGLILYGIAGCLLTGLLGGAVSGASSLVPRQVGPVPALLVELAGFVALLVLHAGLLTEVACYGLWKRRRWGITLGRGLAILYMVFCLIGLVIAIVVRAGIVMSLVGLLINLRILMYLFEVPSLLSRLRQVLASAISEEPPTSRA